MTYWENKGHVNVLFNQFFLCDSYLIRFLQNINELIDFGPVCLSEECVRCSFVVRSASSADSVYVVFDVGWEVVIDDEFDIINIYSDERKEILVPAK